MPRFTRPGRNRPRGFTLVELLVVMIVIAVLVALLFPAVQKVREAARRNSCLNNIRQLAIASITFEAAKGHYTSSWNSTVAQSGSSDVNGWSAQATLLPYIEKNNMFDAIDFRQDYGLAPDITTADGAVTKLSALRVSTFLCPSEERDEVRISGGIEKHYPINYAVNLGTWFVFDPATGEGGPGAFYPDSDLGAKAFTDGLTTTLAFAEVKGWNPYYRNEAVALGATMPLDPSEICNLTSSAQFKDSSGHTEWVDGRAHQIGFTTTFTPNDRVICTENGEAYDVDWTSWQEGKGLAGSTPTQNPTYAAVTARSYHGDGVNVALMDGSVRWFDNDVNLGVWRAYSTRAGKEIMPNEEK